MDGLPVSLRVDRDAVPDDTRVRVEVLDKEDGARFSQLGFAFRVTFEEAASKQAVQPTGRVLMDVDYSAVAGLYNDDFASRLRVISIPKCRVDAATKESVTPAADSCPAMRPLVTQKNNTGRSTLTVDVGPDGLQPVDDVASSSDPAGVDSGAEPAPVDSSTTTVPSTSTTSTSTPPPDEDRPLPSPGDGSTTSTTTATTLPPASSTTVPSVTDGERRSRGIGARGRRWRGWGHVRVDEWDGR